MKKLIIGFSLIFVFNQSNAQDFDILYEMVDLGPKVNSRYHDSAPVISPDGNTLYFFRANHPENKFGKENSQDIWYCERDENGQWEEAIHMESPLNNNQFNQVMSVLDDGNTLLIRGGKGKKDTGVSLVKRVNDKWTEPEPIDIDGLNQMNNGVFSGACMSSDGRVLILYFSENKEAKWSDLYVSFLESGNKFSRPEKLNATLNTTRDEFGPFISEDMKTLYYASNRPEGYGNMDIYKTERLDDTWLNWSPPVNLGQPVNTTGFDAYFSIDAEGKNAFTTRAYMTADGGSLDILGLIPIPNITLTGTLYNSETNEPIKGDLDYMAINQDNGYLYTDESGKYEVILHKRAKYSFHPISEGFIGIMDSLDLSYATGDIEIVKDFYLNPQKADIRVFGSVYEKNTDFPLDAAITFSLDNKVIATCKSESIQGYYSTKLPDEGDYKISITRDGFKSGVDSISIHTTESFLEVEKNLYLDPNITLRGYVLSQKDNSAISQQSINYANNIGESGIIESNEQGYFEVVLPSLGKYYFKSTLEGFINLSDSLMVESYSSRENLNKDLFMIPIEVGVTVRLNNIFFDFDKATLRKESFLELDQVVEFLKQNSSIKIEIGGHTDDQGSDEYNKNLSQGRAESVRTYLLEHGIDDNRVVAMGYGESQPQVTNDTEEGRQTNRRVEFRVLGK